MDYGKYRGDSCYILLSIDDRNYVRQTIASAIESGEFDSTLERFGFVLYGGEVDGLKSTKQGDLYAPDGRLEFETPSSFSGDVIELVKYSESNPEFAAKVDILSHDEMRAYLVSILPEEGIL